VTVCAESALSSSSTSRSPVRGPCRSASRTTRCLRGQARSQARRSSLVGRSRAPRSLAHQPAPRASRSPARRRAQWLARPREHGP
jgi:hypothetical protein